MKRREFISQSLTVAAGCSLASGSKQFFGGVTQKAAMPSYLKGYEALWTKDPKAANAQWFREARFGLFMHYGVSSLLGHVWAMYGKYYGNGVGRVQLQAPIPIARYTELAQQFTAENFSADHITDLALEAGCRYVNMTTRHHDGFALWDSASEPFNAMNSAAHRDLVRELSDACAEKGLGFLPYWSLGRDWRNPNAYPDQRPPYVKYYGEPDPHYPPVGQEHVEKYNEFVRKQVTELLTNYKLAGIWFDGVGVVEQHMAALQVQELYDYIHHLQPDALISCKSGATGTEDFIACEGIIASYPGDIAFETLMKRGVPREVCSNIGKGWGYNAEFAAQTLSLDKAWQQLRDCTAQGANWLADTGPRPDGSINPPHAALFRSLGEKIRQQGYPPQSGPQFEADKKKMEEEMAKRLAANAGNLKTP